MCKFGFAVICKHVYNAQMKKTCAIELLGGTPKKAAAAMGYRSVQAIYLWPDELPQATADRVRGVLARIGAPSRSRRTKPTPEVEHG